MKSVVVWFRRDLRLADNPALVAAARLARESGAALLPLFVWSPEDEKPWSPGAASMAWLDASLRALDESLRAHGSRLCVRRAPTALGELRKVAREADAIAVFWNRLYDPATIERDTQVKAGLEKDGVEAKSFNAALLREPWELKTKSGTPFQVYGAFWRAFVELGDPEKPLRAPAEWPSPPQPFPTSLSIDQLALRPAIAWDAGFWRQWTPGEEGARKALAKFRRGPVERYAEGRDCPGVEGTSRLSPHLHFGEIGPRAIWWAFPDAGSDDAIKYLKEIAWREFAHHLLFHFPHTDRKPLRTAFAKFPWRTDAKLRRRWERGQTGYPIVDAGMRELWSTGWMHNRVRMIVASFLVKHLLQPWQAGAEWFWDTLVDADLASNSFGWQWTAGCGADAAPYFRVFNPVLQGEKFDPDGVYVKKWVPELAEVPKKFVHQPWLAGAARPASYPEPVVDHATARDGALKAFASIRGGAK